jgi:hypothetical protein
MYKPHFFGTAWEILRVRGFCGAMGEGVSSFSEGTTTSHKDFKSLEVILYGCDEKFV